MDKIVGAAPQLDISFVRGVDGATYVDRRLFRWPFTISRTFRLDRAPAGMLTLIVQSVSGAIQAEDSLVQRICVGAGAAAHVTTPGATSVHRAPPGMDASDAVLLTVEDGGFAEYLPEPRILFPDSSLSQSIRVRVAENGIAIVSDAFMVHDPTGGGREFRHFASEIRIERPEGQTVSIDRMDLDCAPRRIGRRARYAAYGTLFVVAPCSTESLATLRGAIEARLTLIEGLYAAVSPLPQASGVSLRIAAADGFCVRQGMEAGWSAARRHFVGREPDSRRKWTG